MKRTGRQPKGKARRQIKTLTLDKPVIAVTGSAGKTTTKEMIAAILSRRWSIYKSMYNKNFLGNTRAHARRIKGDHRAVVLEFGILRSGHIRKHCEIIQPNMGVITNIGTAHIGNFGGKKQGIARAKSELIRHMNDKGTVFLNMDCTYSRQMREQPFIGGFAGTFRTVGITYDADYKAAGIQIGERGISFDCRIDGSVEHFTLPVLGEHNVYNALFAIAVTHTLGFHPADIREGLSAFLQPRKRLMRYRYSGNLQVLDDTFSSNPEAAKAAVDVLCQIASETKVAVLGSMLEMGAYDEKAHIDVGRYFSGKSVDYLFTYGSSARHIARAAIASGFPPQRVVHCLTKEKLHQLLARHIKPNTAFLIKGSHKLKMGETALFLRKKCETIRFSHE